MPEAGISTDNTITQYGNNHQQIQTSTRQLEVPQLENWWYSDGSTHHTQPECPNTDYKHRRIPNSISPNSPIGYIPSGIIEPSESEGHYSPKTKVSFFPGSGDLPDNLDTEKIKLSPFFDPDEDECAEHPTKDQLRKANPNSIFQDPSDPRNAVLADIDRHLAELRARALELNAISPSTSCDPQGTTMGRRGNKRRQQRPLTAEDIDRQHKAIIEMAFEKTKLLVTGSPTKCSLPSIGTYGRPPNPDPTRAIRGVGSFSMIHRTSRGFCKPGHFVDVGPPPSMDLSLIPNNNESQSMQQGSMDFGDLDSLRSTTAVIDSLRHGIDTPAQRSMDIGLRRRKDRSSLEATSATLNQLRAEEYRCGCVMRTLETSRLREPSGGWYSEPNNSSYFSENYARSRAYDDGKRPRAVQSLEEYRGLMKTIGTLDI